MDAEQQETAGEGRFENQVAFITGASDQGIGGAVADRMASEGASIFAAGLEEPKRLIKRLRRKNVAIEWKHCDITDATQVRAAVSASVEAFGEVDILVNNAGVEIASWLETFDEPRWLELININLNGAIRVTRAVLPHLASPGGVVVNMSSALSLGGCAGFSIYSAAKSGLNGFTRSMAWELASQKIRVVGVAPGLVHTPMIYKHAKHLTPEMWEQINRSQPLGMGSPHDVAAAVTFLSSREARWITGVTLPVGWAESYPLPTDPFLRGAE